MISIDCALLRPERAFFARFLGTFLLPFVSAALIVLVFGIRVIIRVAPGLRLRPEEAKEKTQAALVVVLYQLYPIIAEQAFGLFRCVDVGAPDGRARLYHDMTVKCYQGQHLIWVFLMGVPMMAYIILLPAGMIWSMHKLDCAALVEKIRSGGKVETERETRLVILFSFIFKYVVVHVASFRVVIAAPYFVSL
jgi:hypothetical protein